MLGARGIELAKDDVERLIADDQATAFLDSFPDPLTPPPRADVLARQRGAPSLEALEPAPAPVQPAPRSRMFDPPLGFPLAMVVLLAAAALVVWLLTRQ